MTQLFGVLLIEVERVASKRQMAVLHRIGFCDGLSPVMVNDFTDFNIVECLDSHIRALYVIMDEALSALPEARGRISELNSGMWDRLAGFVQAGIDNGEFNKDGDPSAAAVLIVGLLRGVVMQ